MNFNPLGKRVLVKAVQKEEVTAGGLYIPDAAQERPQEGIVIKVGPGTNDHQMTVKEGMNVMYGKYSGTEVELDNQKYLIMNEDEILLCYGDDNE